MVSRIRCDSEGKKTSRLQPLSETALQSFLQSKLDHTADPASQLFQRIGLFQQALFDEAPFQPRILIVADTVSKLSKLLAETNVVHAAVRQAPRRNISGRGGAVEHLNGIWARSSVYKLIHSSLGIQDLDALRLAKDMDEVISISPALRQLICETSKHYEKLVRSRLPQLPRFYKIGR